MNCKSISAVTLMSTFFYLVGFLPNSLGKLATTTKKVACHQESDYINNKTIRVCGDYTEYPDTLHDVLPSDPLYSWISNGTYNQNAGRIKYYDPKEKTNFQADVLFPSNVNTDTIRATTTAITSPKDVHSIAIKYTITKSVETTITHSGNISIGGEIANKLHNKKFSVGGGYTFTYSKSTYYTKSVSRTDTYINDYNNHLMELVQYKAYIPIKIQMYKVYSPGSYIYKDAYFLYKIRDVVIRSWESFGFTDPWSIRGFVSGHSVHHDFIAEHPSLS